MKKKKTTTSWWWSWVLTTALCCCCLSRASIDIKTLPPDLRWLGGVATAGSPVLPRISPEWAGDHSAVLDGDQGRVILSWTINEDVVDFMVSICLCVRYTAKNQYCM
jgi:hypothetical protein